MANADYHNADVEVLLSRAACPNGLLLSPCFVFLKITLEDKVRSLITNLRLLNGDHKG